MIRLRFIVMLACALLVGCSDGGPVGTGISSFSGISGNVVDVQSSGDTAPSRSGVRVSLEEVPGLQTMTDEEGNFELTGDFAGTVTLRFQADGVDASQPVDVPDEARLVLQDIMLQPGAVRFQAARVLGFYGQVAVVDCAEGTLLVNDRRQVANQFLVRITDETILLRGDGSAVTCDDISQGNFVTIEGVARFADRTISALTITLGQSQPGKPTTSEVGFRGRVAVVNCSGTMLLLDDSSIGKTRIRLLPETAITDGNDQTLSCSDIHTDDRVQGRGIINVRRPEVIDALRVKVLPPL